MPQSAPEVPPASSAQASAAAVSTVPAPAPRSTAAAAASTAARDAALHADAVVAVAGDRVDVGRVRSTLASMTSRSRVERGEDPARRLRGRPRRRRDWDVSTSARSTVRSAWAASAAAATAPLAVGRRRRRARSRGLEFVVEPEQGEGGAGHVEAGDEFADLGSTLRCPRRPAAGRRGGRRRRALRT